VPPCDRFSTGPRSTTILATGRGIRLADIVDPNERAMNESDLDSGKRAPLRVPVVEETLEVQKTQVDQGGYRLVKEVSTREQLVDELLRDQRVEIERRPVGRSIEGSAMPAPRYEGDTLVIPVVQEILVTEKRLVLVEEVRVTPVEGTHRQPQTVTLRKEEIAIERLAAEDSSAREP
jgi:uncharacterized protein (TIGR02271 family)